jgi:hypothetical protein
MLARGYDGRLPDEDHHAVAPRRWLTGLSLPVMALVALLVTSLVWGAR